MEPEENKAEPPSEPANPIDEMELPRVEPTVLSNKPKPQRKQLAAISILILLAAAVAAYILLRSG